MKGCALATFALLIAASVIFRAALLLTSAHTPLIRRPTSGSTATVAAHGAAHAPLNPPSVAALAVAVAPASAAAPPAPPLPASIPRRFLFLYGLWGADFRAPLGDGADCDFSAPAPPPCANLSAHAHLLPPPIAAALAAWTARYPAWEATLLDRGGLGRLVAARFPELAPPLAALPSGVQRADVARLLLLAAYGGVYADVDAAPAAGDLGALLSAHADASALFFEEALLSPAQAAAAGAAHAVRGGVPEARQRIANYFIAAAPGEACIAAALREALARARSHPALAPADADYEVLFTTGPDMLTDAVHRLRGWALDGSDIVGSARLVEGSDIETPLRGAAAAPPHPCAVVPRPVDQLYFSHAAAGTWKGARS